jgi:isoleucyl-tRNA synthetase
MWDRDLLYEGHKVVPYCARCGTALSSHEVAQGYQDVEDPSVYVRFPVVEAAGALRAGDTLLSGRRPRGRSSPTPRSRSTPS